MAGLGVSRVVLGKILNHADASVTSVYDRHGYDAEKREALALWTDLKDIVLRSDTIGAQG
jgi:hypothetical protein